MSGSSPDLSSLEPGQRSNVLELPLPQKRLNRRTVWMLACLRVYVVLAVLVVVIAFARALR